MMVLGTAGLEVLVEVITLQPVDSILIFILQSEKLFLSWYLMNELKLTMNIYMLSVHGFIPVKGH